MLESGLPESVGSEEPVVRFVFSSRLCKGGVIKYQAMLPNPKDPNREASVFRHGIEPAKDLKLLGEQAALESGRPLRGAAIIVVSSITEAGLTCVAKEPPARHAGIRNWPWIEGDYEAQKAQQKMIAAELAQEVTQTVLYPD